MPGVYLAGPTVFEPDPEAIFAVMRRICARHGLTGIAPLDGQDGLADLPPGHARVTRIVQADIALMQQADAGVFCLDGFRRGPEMDPGTAFEIGYMHALGKPLAGWTRDVRDYPTRVAAFFGLPVGAPCDPDGILIHSETCLQNAMTHIGIELSGGGVYADPDWEVAFEKAILSLT